MKKQKGFEWRVVGILLMMQGLSAWAGPIITISNPTNVDQILADLTVKGKNPGETKVIKIEGDNNKPDTDNVRIPPNEARVFDAGFEITSYIISEPKSPTADKETKVFNVTQLEGKRVGFIQDPADLIDLFLSIDYAQYNFDPPEAGEILNFVGGSNAITPGWFVGTTMDINTGDITNPYTGSVLIANTVFEVTTGVSEPSSLLLLSIGILGLFAGGNARKLNRRMLSI